MTTMKKKTNFCEIIRNNIVREKKENEFRELAYIFLFLIDLSEVFLILSIILTSVVKDLLYF